jgi:hypothetical protein
MSPKYVITVSFKDSEKYMYDWIRKHCSPGAAVKDVLKEHIEQEQSTKRPQVVPVKSNDLDILDF